MQGFEKLKCSQSQLSLDDLGCRKFTSDTFDLHYSQNSQRGMRDIIQDENNQISSNTDIFSLNEFILFEDVDNKKIVLGKR